MIDLPFWRQTGVQDGAGPLLVWLHGAGEKGSQPQDHCEAPIMREAQRWMPACTVLAPCAPLGCSGWSIPAVLALMDHAIAMGWANPAQIIIAGTSMGGRGAYELAYDHADRCAALIAIAAAGLPTLMPRLHNLPTWMVHGAADDVVPVTWARWVAAAHPDANYHELPETGHACAATTLGDPALWQWLHAVLAK